MFLYTLIACVDGLKGFPDAINAVFPQTQRLIMTGMFVHIRQASLFHGWRRVNKAGSFLQVFGRIMPSCPHGGV